MPIDTEVVTIKVEKSGSQGVSLDIRLRGGKDWLYIDNLFVPWGKEVVIYDGQEKSGPAVTRKKPRESRLEEATNGDE